MGHYKKISLLLSSLVGLLIFGWSSVPGSAGAGGISYLPILYHIGIFFLFSAFLLLAFWKEFSIKIIFLVALFSAIYAVLDETHQAFIPGRSAGIFDFWLDAIGIAGSAIFVALCRGFRK